jgi:NitT/TauT family transport system substrate-binding protein
MSKQNLLNRTTRRQALWLLGGATVGLAMHGCTQKTDPAATATSAPADSSSKTLSVGVVAWPGYAGHYVAMAKGFFKDEGITVQESFFQDGSSSLTAYLAKRVDLSWGTSADAVQSADKVASARIIKLVDYSNGADGILGRGMTQPQDLKGKKIARENLLFENILLQSYLAKGGLTLNDVTLIDTPAATAASAFAGKQVDVAVTYEPYLSKTAKEAGGDVIFSSKGTNLIADVISTHEELIQQKKDAMLAYLRAVDKAVKLVNSGDQEALTIVGKQLGASVEETKAQLAGLKIFDLSGDKETGFNPSNPNNLIQNLEFTVKVASDLKMLSKPLNVSKLYDDSLVKSL